MKKLELELRDLNDLLEKNLKKNIKIRFSPRRLPEDLQRKTRSHWRASQKRKTYV